MATELQGSNNTSINLSETDAPKCNRAGFRVTISSRIIQTLSFYLKRVGNPSGNLQWKILKLTGSFPGTELDSVNYLAVSSISTAAFTLYTATMSNVFVNEEVRFIVTPDTFVNGANYIAVAYQNTDVKASEYFTYSSASAWTNSTAEDCAYQYTYTTELVTTQAVTAISGTTATGNGNVITVTGATEHGHCWKVYVSATSPPTTADSKTTKGIPAATGAFTSAMTGFVAGTKYGVRAYITNAAGTFYGAQTVFVADKGTVAPTDTLTRVSGITRQFWAGKGGNAVYDCQITTGGISTTYIPPVGTRQEIAAVPQEHPTLVTQAMAGLAGPGFQYVDYVRWVNTRGPEWVQKTYGHIPLYQEWIKIMIDQFRKGAK